MWEETLVFTVHMPELALVRFLVWDHDPIGQDFIGQRTIAFNSMMPGKTVQDMSVHESRILLGSFSKMERFHLVIISHLKVFTCF